MSVGSWRDGYQRGFLDGVEMRKKWDEEHNVSAFDRHIAEVKESRDEWDEDDSWKNAREEYYDYYHAGITIGTGEDVTRRVTRTFNNVFKPGQSNYRLKPFDDVVFPDKCQECDGDCKVC